MGPPHDACTLPVLLDNTMLASLSSLAGSSVVSDTPAVGPGPLQSVIEYEEQIEPPHSLATQFKTVHTCRGNLGHALPHATPAPPQPRIL